MQKAAIKVGRYIHAKQMRRAKREVKFIRVRLGRLIRDIERKVKDVTHKLPIDFDVTL